MTIRWAIAGVGIAGAARARAIQRDPRSELVAVWRGRNAAATGAPVVGSFEEALAAADAVAVCSPNEHHPDQVRQALRAGRHVVCEFPLAPDAETAAELFALAPGVLHVEHIELLSGVALTLRANVQAIAVRRVEVRFERSGPAEIPGAELALANVARLHRVVDVGGPVASVDAVRAAPGRLEGQLTLRTGAPVAFAFEQAPYHKRRTVLEVEDHRHLWRQESRALYRDGAPQTVLEASPLFEQDHHHAMARIVDGAPAYVGEGAILHVLRLVSMLRDGRTGPIA